MSDNGRSGLFRSVTIDLSDSEGRMEHLAGKGVEPGKIRLSCLSQGERRIIPLDVSEDELIDLLQKAIRAGVLSPEFLQKLHSEFEI